MAYGVFSSTPEGSLSVFGRTGKDPSRIKVRILVVTKDSIGKNVALGIRNSTAAACRARL